MVKVREGIEFPIIPEDLEFSEDELSPELFELLLFTCAMSQMAEEPDAEYPKIQ
jgi:hypothetical protein